MATVMSDLSHHAQKALDALNVYGRLIRDTSSGVTVWVVGRKAPGLGLAWRRKKRLGTFMPASVQELLDRGLVVWEGADQVRRP
jgi:hypothetical protein